MRFLRHLTPSVLLVGSIFFLSGCDSVEERAEKHFQSAVALIADGDVDRAIVELRNVFNLDSDHMAARRTMAELQMERGNRQGAYRHYLSLAESYPDDLESRILLSEIAFDAGSWEELDRHGAQAEELASDNPRVQVIALVRDYRSAIDDKDPATRRDLGRQAEGMLAEQPENVLLRNILIDNAIREQDFTRALEEIDWMIAFEPTNSQHYQERLRVLVMLGDTSAVEAQLRQIIEVFPDDPVHTATLIRFYVSREDLDSAEAVLRDLSSASDPEDPGPTVDLIRFLTTFRDAEAVRVEIDKAISERADPLPFQTIEAALDFSLGNRTKAISTLTDVLAESEPSEQTRGIKITLAKMLLATGNEVGARTNVEEVLVEDETHPEALKMQAAWQIEADDTDAAIGGLRMALDRNPQDAESMTLMANAYTRAGQFELARDFLAQAVKASGNAPAETLRYARLLIGEERYQPAEDILLAALRLAPSDTDILFILGQLYLEMDDFGRARGVIDSLRRIGSQAAVQAANGIEAEQLNRQNGSESAISFLEDLANDASATLATKIALVRARLATGDTAGALVLAEDVKQENPTSEALKIVVAITHIANGNLAAGEALYRDILASSPTRPRIWLELARLKLRESDRDAAKALIEEGLGHTPEDANLLWAEASFEEQDGNIEAAIEIYQALYENNSNSIVVANNLASLLATYRSDATSLDRAWMIARRFRDANIPAVKDTYGWILHRRGSSSDALPYLEAAAKDLPSDPLVQYHLGQVYVALDRPEDALIQFRIAVEISGPADMRPQIEEARELVQSILNAGTAEN